MDGAISLSIVAPARSDQGWVFDKERPTYRDHLHQTSSLHELYTRGAPGYSGRATVPVLWDKATDTIVNNESSEIIRMLGTAFDELTGNTLDLYPEAHRDEIDRWNEKIFSGFNNGVYRSGFARTQAAYEEAVGEVFETLDALEAQLSGQRYLCGDVPTEADWRLFPTLVRFDVAYHSAFRCNRQRIVDYPNLWAYTRDLYQQPGVAETVTPDIYRRGYHSPSPERNPLGIVPVGPEINFMAPHDRDKKIISIR